MVEVFEAKQRLLKELGWHENPFVKDLRSANKEDFLKYYCPFESTEILKRLAFDTKACLLVGPKGVGKTSALYFVSYGLPEAEFRCLFFKEPPVSVDALAEEAGFGNKPGFFSGLMSVFGGQSKKQPVSRSELAERLKNERKKLVFFIDEAHLEKTEEMYMEFKYLLDDVPNLRIVFSALGSENFPDSLVQLIGDNNVFQRKHFTSQEMTTIIEHRINAVGGKGVKPFPAPFLREVLTEHNLLSPRYVFDELNNHLASLALGKSKWQGASEYANDPIIQSAISDSIATSGERITTAHADWWVSLSPSQKQILELLLHNGELSLSEIMAETKLPQNTCFNALYQMRGDDNAEKKRKPNVPFPLVGFKGKAAGGRKKNLYFVDAKVKNIFTLN